MVREHTKINIPEEYKENERKGLCRICGGTIKRPFRKYCSIKCFLEYQKCFKTWSILRDKIISEKGRKCELCGSKDKLEVDHIVAIVNGGDMWNQDNLQVLCHKCHSKKTRKDVYKSKVFKEGQKELVPIPPTDKSVGILGVIL